MTDATRVAVFVGVVAVVVGAAAITPMVLGDGTTAPESVDEEYDTESILAETSIDAGTGTIDVASGEQKTVLIDRRHGNDVDEETLQPLVTALTDAGHEVRYLNQGDRVNQSLASADAFVIAEPGERYGNDDAAGVEAFADAGGRVLVVVGPDSGIGAPAGLLFGGLQPESEVESVSSRLGITVGTGYVYNMGDNGGNFQSVYAEPASGDELADGVDRTVFHNVAPVSSATGTPLLTATDGSEYSETQERGEFHLAVRNGNAVAVGDPGVFANPENNREDNDVFLSNVADFLVTGDKDPATAPDDSGGFGGGGDDDGFGDDEGGNEGGDDGFGDDEGDGDEGGDDESDDEDDFGDE